MQDKKYQIYKEIVLRDVNRVADHMAGIAKTIGENETERIWTAKVPPSLKQILIENMAVTKVHFQLDRKISTIHLERREF